MARVPWLSTSTKQQLWIGGLVVWAAFTHGADASIPIGIAGVIFGMMLEQTASNTHAESHVCISRNVPDMLSPEFTTWLEKARAVAESYIAAHDSITKSHAAITNSQVGFSARLALDVTPVKPEA